MLKHKKLLLFSILPILILPFLVNMSNNNTCPSYWDYILINFNKNCYYNPDVHMDTPQLVEKYTGPGNCKRYNLTTSDGYVLTMFRIHRENPIGVILLQPSVIGGDIMWLLNGNQSLPFLLWRMNYDVWLSNQRGSEYSRDHLNFTDKDEEFWNFGVHEIAVYDFQDQFELIYNETNGTQVLFVGYSKSGAEALIYASLKLQQAKKFVRAFILLVPSSILDHFLSLIGKLLFYMVSFFNFDTGEFKMVEPFRWAITKTTLFHSLINLIGSMAMGIKHSDIEPELIPFLSNRMGRGISYKIIQHYSQIFKSKNHFPMYDYGTETNRIKYGSDEPPEYPLEKIAVPIHVIHGGYDSFATPMDMDLLCNHLLTQGVAEKIFIPKANHIDLITNKHIRNLTFNHIFAILEKYKNSNY